jgi:hypothetical protein
MKIVIIQECSGGNDMVGDMWQETLICDENTTLKEILAWRKKVRGSGRTIIAKDTEEVGNELDKRRPRKI